MAYFLRRSSSRPSSAPLPTPTTPTTPGPQQFLPPPTISTPYRTAPPPSSSSTSSRAAPTSTTTPAARPTTNNTAPSPSRPPAPPILPKDGGSFRTKRDDDTNNSNADVLLGGALTTDDLFELLAMEVENLSVKSRSSDGIAKSDLKPLIKAIADLRSVGRGHDEVIRRAVEFQMKMTQQFVVQTEIKNALSSRNYEAMKDAREKIKLYNLSRLKYAKELEKEMQQMEREKVREVEADNKRLQREMSDMRSASKPKRSLLQRIKGGGGGGGSREDDDGYEDDDLMLADAPPVTRQTTVPARNTDTTMPGGSALAMAGVTKQLEERQERADAVKYDLLVEAMKRVKDVLDAPNNRGPGAILSAAGPQMDLVTGDTNGVHIWYGEFHAFVRARDASTSHVVSSGTTQVVGEVDHKGSPGMRWEVRMMKSTTLPDASSSSSASSSSKEEITRLYKRIEDLENELAQVKGGGSNGPANSPRQATAAVELLMKERANSVRQGNNLEEEWEGKPPPSTPPPTARGVPLGEMPEYAEFFKMLKIGVPRDAIKFKMEIKGLNSAVIDMDPLQPLPGSTSSLSSSSASSSTTSSSSSAALLTVAQDPRFQQYFKMLSVGVPRFAVDHKMRSKGLDPTVLDTPDAPAPLADAATQTAAPSPLKLVIKPKPKDATQWKKLHWQVALKPAHSRTVWSRAHGFELTEAERKELENLFSFKPTSNDATRTDETKDSTASEEKLQILESQRANNVGIVLSRFQGLTSKQLRKMICSMELIGGCNADDVRAMLAFLPTTEEADKLRLYMGQRDSLEPAEKHFLALMEIPRFQSRVSCFLFKLRFEEVVADVTYDLEATSAACRNLLENEKLPRLLTVVLTLGNALNSHGGRLNEEDGFVPATGFRMSALAKLKLAKSYGSNKQTALHYLVSIIQDRQRHVLNFLVAETDQVRKAAGVAFSNVKSAIKSLAIGVKELENEVRHAASVKADADASQAITNEDLDFFASVEAFHTRARRDVMDLSARVGLVEKEFEELVTYLGDDPVETTPEGLFKSLVNFFDDVVVAANENDLAKAQATEKKSRTRRGGTTPPKAVPTPSATPPPPSAATSSLSSMMASSGT